MGTPYCFATQVLTFIVWQIIALAPFRRESKRKAKWIFEKRAYNKSVFATAGNRTRVDCLEGSHANLYTTIARHIERRYAVQYKH